jgi:hypothetical protein
VDLLADGIAVAALVLGGWQFVYQRGRNKRLDASTTATADRAEKQDRLLEAQLAELRRRQEADAHADAAEQRKQAEKIKVEWSASSTPPPMIVLSSGDEVYAAFVENHSERPITDVRAGIRFGKPSEQYSDAAAHAIYNRSRGGVSLREAQMSEGDRIRLIKPGDEHMFVFPWSISANRYAEIAVRFVDSAGASWQINPDYSVTELIREQWKY